MPATIIVDIELAVHNVVRTLFPASSLKGCLFHVGQALWRKLQELGLSAKYGKEDNGISKWFRLFIGTAFVPPPQAMTAYQLITSTYTPDDRRCIKFNDYFMNTWLSGDYPIAMWNQFRSDVPRTNKSCEGYNSRLAKRALQLHLNIYAVIRLFQAEQINKEAYILLLESGQQQANVASNTVKLTMI